LTRARRDGWAMQAVYLCESRPGCSTIRRTTEYINGASQPPPLRIDVVDSHRERRAAPRRRVSNNPKYLLKLKG
jgi:hypothetical protein